MARDCNVYAVRNDCDSLSKKPIKGKENCETEISNRNPRDTSDNAKFYSDPTGKGKGTGVTKSAPNKDSECFTKTLIQDITFNAHQKKGDEIVTKRLTIKVNKNIAKELSEILEKIYKETSFRIEKIFCYDYRDAKNEDGTSKGVLSSHAYGIAVDLNGGHNPYSKDKKFNNACSLCEGKIGNDDLHIRTTEHKVVKIFDKYGWKWGGSFGDRMHFSKYGG